MDFTVNDDLTAYTPDEIAALITTGREALAALFALPTPAPSDVAEATRIKAAVDSLVAEQNARAGAAAAMAALATETAAAAVAEAEVEDETDDEVEDTTDDAAEDGDEDETEDASDDTEGEDAVTASGTTKKTAVKRTLGGARPVGTPDSRKPIAITAAADVQGFATGSDLTDLVDVGVALVNRMRGFPRPAGIEGGQMQRYGVAQFRKEYEPEFVANGNNDMEVLSAVTKEARLPGGSLVAAGGWCAPSETLYDLCEGETTDGLIDIPEFNVSRGGVRTTPGPSFADLYADTGFTQTEAEAIAGTEKGCYEIECPAFEEVRLDAVGLCIKVPILTNAAYPELTRRVISGSLIAHQHRVSADMIGRMVTASTAVTPATVGSVTSDTLNAIGLVAQTLREEYRLSMNETIEVVVPAWVREAIRADIGHRSFGDLALADAAITAYFSARKTRVQWVYNWQQLGDGQEGYPATFTALVYPAGTFAKGTSDVISLDAVYDAASLNVNTYTGLFMEEGVLLLQNCWKSKIVTIAVCAGGNTGAADNTGCFNLTP
jgi:hypothetical protein